MRAIFFLFLLSAPALAASKKLYWFIPDGLRADRSEFNIFEWAKAGKMPNLKKMMDEGAYGYSIPDFPSHTPTNFASLLTGTTPDVHGISDGPMHTEGFPLEKPSAAGFASLSKKVSPFYLHLEKSYGMKAFLLSVPGTTPPELKSGATVRGRWGGWGLDFHSVIFEPEQKLAGRKAEGKAYRLFFLGLQLTKFVPTERSKHWDNKLSGDDSTIRSELESQGIKIQMAIHGKKEGKYHSYEKVDFSLDGKNTIASLKQGQWSEWIPVTVATQGISVPTHVRIKVIKLWPNGDFRLRMLIDNLNTKLAEPPYAAEKLLAGAGPMVDFADNWPHQLIQEPEDKQTFLDEAAMSWEWHARAVPVTVKEFNPDVFVHDIYTPNLMLESRWWFDAIHTKPRAQAESEWADVERLYRGIDDILGETLKNAGPDTLVVFSSDHGVCHLRRLVKLNNFFAKKGWLKFSIDPKTGESSIDWKNTKVVYLKMMNVFISPTGLGGNWARASGEEYKKLRNEVIKELRGLHDTDGKRPLKDLATWEDAKNKYRLPQDRIGDLVIEASLNYFWHEEVDDTGKVFVKPKTSGYKQSIDAIKNECMWTPVVFKGSGVKKAYAISKPIKHADQAPTILRLLGKSVPKHMTGKVLEEIFQE